MLYHLWPTNDLLFELTNWRTQEWRICEVWSGIKENYRLFQIFIVVLCERLNQVVYSDTGGELSELKSEASQAVKFNPFLKKKKRKKKVM